MSTKEIMNICGEDLQIGLYYLISKNAFKIHENNCFLDNFQAATNIIGPNIKQILCQELLIGHSADNLSPSPALSQCFKEL